MIGGRAAADQDSIRPAGRSAKANNGRRATFDTTLVNTLPIDPHIPRARWRNSGGMLATSAAFRPRGPRVAASSRPRRPSAQAPIKIGEINSFSGIGAPFTGPYRAAVEMAVEEVNAKGGVLGRKVEVIFRDDKGQPAEAVKHAQELVASEKVAPHLGHVPLQRRPRGVGLGQAEQDACSWPPSPSPRRITWSKGHDYVVPRAAEHVRAGPHAGREGRQDEVREVGDHRARTTSTASARGRRSAIG